MADDLATLIVQTGGQVTDMLIHSMLIGAPSMLNLIGNIIHPLLWVIPVCSPSEG
jgi:hypothetical protein